MPLTIALAGNPNTGKTTLFNTLTGSNQYVGNWPGVTVEKKEGKLKGHDDVTITDLPGVYSLSPYTLEEVVARNYLINERPDAILNIIDGTNLERNLYLTTQLMELGIPVVCAVNMMDIVTRNGDRINIDRLEKELGCSVTEISALKENGIEQAAEKAVQAAAEGKLTPPRYSFTQCVENTLNRICEIGINDSIPAEQKRWYAIKLFERDEKIAEFPGINKSAASEIEKYIADCEKQLDDDSESIITNERYNYIEKMVKGCLKRKNKGSTVSDKIDRIVTSRILGLPIFAAIMVIVYFFSITTVGAFASDWASGGLFGDGFHLFGISGNYEEDTEQWAEEYVFTKDVSAVINSAVSSGDVKGAEELLSAVEDGDLSAFEQAYSSYRDEFYKNAQYDDSGRLLNGGTSEVYDIDAALGSALDEKGEFTAPDPADYGVWVPGIPVLIEQGLDKLEVDGWLKGLILDGIVGGVGAVLGFVPQMFVLFIFLAILESCGYMSRVAFILDRIFRKFGLSGKSFIPILIGTGCGVPGIMASRTIENERDRRMTIITTTFIPCGAKLPVISMIATALFDGTWWVGPSAYFLGLLAIIVSGIILKKTRMFAGEDSPFIMQLPRYHLPTVKNVLRSMWDRGWSFIKKAGTVILLSSVIIWAGSVFGWAGGGNFGFSADMELSDSILGKIGDAIKSVFAPLGFGNAPAAVATVMGIAAKEEIVGVFGVLNFEGLSRLSGYAFLTFNLLCAPCVAAISAIRREMNSAGWTLFALGYQCGFAYTISLFIYQFGLMFSGTPDPIGLAAAILLLIFMIYLLVRPDKNRQRRKI